MESIAIIGEPAWAEKASKPKDSRREPHAAKQGVGDDVSRVDPRNDFESESKWAKYLNCLRPNPPRISAFPTSHVYWVIRRTTPIATLRRYLSIGRYDAYRKSLSGARGGEGGRGGLACL